MSGALRREQFGDEDVFYLEKAIRDALFEVVAQNGIQRFAIGRDPVGPPVWRIVARYQREVDRSLASLDLTNLQFVTLALAAWFGHSGEPVNQSELAGFGGIQTMQMSHMLKTLEGKGFISRKRNKSDTRAKRITVTRGGLKALCEALPRVIAVQSRLFGEEGLPGHSLHKTLLDLDRRLHQMEQA